MQSDAIKKRSALIVCVSVMISLATPNARSKYTAAAAVIHLE